ncbi:MAG: hypothetical protein GY711_19800 [bacterium]|nr:hypothetical protein [bacterium]
MQQGRPREAEGVLRTAYEALVAARGPRDRYATRARERLRDVYEELGEVELARALVEPDDPARR